MRAWVAIVTLGLSFSAFSQTAQDELEKQLKDMVGKPPTKLLVEFEGLDQPNYKLIELHFNLDGQNLQVPAVEKLNEGKTTIWHGDIKPGSHRLESTAIVTDIAGVLFSYEAGYKWTVKTRTFDQQPGLEVRVLVTPQLAQGERDPKKKFSLESTADVKMLAKLEDGSMPDVPKPNLPAKEEVDAGVAVAQLTPAEKAKLAADEKKRAKEEAAQKAKAAAEEKKRQRDEALAAKKAAAEEKKRQRDEALAAKHSRSVAQAEPVKAAEPVKVAEPEPAAALAVAEVDAGAPAVVAVAEPPKPAPPPKPVPAPVVEEPSSMLPILIGGGIALLGVIVFLATRRKSPPPQV